MNGSNEKYQTTTDCQNINIAQTKQNIKMNKNKAGHKREKHWGNSSTHPKEVNSR